MTTGILYIAFGVFGFIGAVFGLQALNTLTGAAGWFGVGQLAGDLFAGARTILYLAMFHAAYQVFIGICGVKFRATLEKGALLFFLAGLDIALSVLYMILGSFSWLFVVALPIPICYMIGANKNLSARGGTLEFRAIPTMFGTMLSAVPKTMPSSTSPGIQPMPQSLQSCTRCGNPMEIGDVFCENCSQKDVTGSLPPQAAYTPPAPMPMPTASISRPRMPLVFLLDTSAATAPYINQLSACLNRFKADVRLDSKTQSILDVAVVQFSDTCNVLQDFTPVENMRPFRLITSGRALYSDSIREALTMTENRVRSQTNSYKPWVILITGSAPADDITAIAGHVQNMQNSDRLRFMALGVQGYNATALQQLTDVVFKMDGTDFAHFFDWINKCMWAVAQTSPGEKPQLPPLQGNVYREI
ncbi:MAG: VWA domain-containing protein [Defluviitaleaceae bacterium]|nr:VWA domain-containing protein [Defluviitaleaceae bacterium]